jgi:hypothetical protein
VDLEGSIDDDAIFDADANVPHPQRIVGFEPDDLIESNPTFGNDGLVMLHEPAATPHSAFVPDASRCAWHVELPCNGQLSCGWLGEIDADAVRLLGLIDDQWDSLAFLDLASVEDTELGVADGAGEWICRDGFRLAS